MFLVGFFRGYEGPERKTKGKDEAERARVSSQARFDEGKNGVGEGETSKEGWYGGQ